MDNPAIQEQYQKWAYPAPIHDLDLWKAEGNYQLNDPALFYEIFFPGRNRMPLDVLIAGCGTHQAACLAYSNSDSNFLAIDISQTSLDHTKYLIEKHNIRNLELKRLSIFDVEELKEEYDLIISTGVLHHLRDPVGGCKALGQCLKPDGVMQLMLYGASLRAGVYLLQKAFKALGLDQGDGDVDLMKECLRNLPPDHAIAKYAKLADDLNSDAGLVDTFLNPQDVAYDVLDLMEFIEAADMKFHSWLDNGDYAIQNYLSQDFAGYRRLMALNPIDRAQFLDNFLQLRGTHRFNICKKEYQPLDLTITEKSMGYIVPMLRAPMKILQKWDRENNTLPTISRAGHKFTLSAELAYFMDAIDGNLSIRQIVSKVVEKSGHGTESVQKAAKVAFSDLYERGHIMLKIAT